jgi:methionine biosynthesis protein MetW
MIDNRKYTYKINSRHDREEFNILERWIKDGSSVLDLGSGDGTLLKTLKDKKHTNGLGIEISPSGIKSAENKGIKTIVGKIDSKLPFNNKEFDYAICNVTLQMVMYPEILLKEMVRVSKKQIITFPNFAYILNRFELLFMGQMPKFMMPGMVLKFLNLNIFLGTSYTHSQTSS